MATTNCDGVSPVNMPCPIEFEQRLKAICAAYPQGFAWDAVDVDGTNMHQLARALALVLNEVEARACEVLPEFTCHTTDEMLPEWYADYGLPDDCGINDLCAKVGAIGGQNCDYYSYLAQLTAEVEDFCCQDVDPEICCGCWNLGCDQMAPAFETQYGGSELGCASLGCPTKQSGGSTLGCGMLGTSSCHVAGYCVDNTASADCTSLCRTDSECDRYWNPASGTLVAGCYTAEAMVDYTGTAHTWVAGITTNDPLFWNWAGTCENNPSMCLGQDDWCLGQEGLGIYEPPSYPATTSAYTITGCWEVGCTELCRPQTPELLCAITRYKPAHTVAYPKWCIDHPT